MASANQNIPAKNFPVKTDWLFAHPWLWLGAGCAMTAWSLVWTLTLGASASDNRVIVLAAGLLFSGAGLWLYWRDRETTYLAAWRAPIALLLGCIFALLFLGVTVAFILSFFMPERVGLQSAALFLTWVSVAPLAFFAARRCLKSNSKERGRDSDEEVGLAFVVMAAICLAGSFTLYADRDFPADWDSMRLFLRVFTAVSLYGSGLVLVSTALRRIMVSVLITIHFLGIASATLSAPPAAPWIIAQAWVRFFRPYLEFVYLINAYHFYAPEPGPASYLWFRVIFETPEGQDQGLWHKVPQLDDDGRIMHPVALEYQRFLSITESISAADPLPPEIIYNHEARLWQPNPFWTVRLNLATMSNDTLVIGAPQPQHQLRIPLQPGVSNGQQVWKPNEISRRLLGSYARFVARKYDVCPDRSGPLSRVLRRQFQGGRFDGNRSGPVPLLAVAELACRFERSGFGDPRSRPEARGGPEMDPPPRERHLGRTGAEVNK